MLEEERRGGEGRGGEGEGSQDAITGTTQTACEHMCHLVWSRALKTPLWLHGKEGGWRINSSADREENISPSPRPDAPTTPKKELGYMHKQYSQSKLKQHAMMTSSPTTPLANQSWSAPEAPCIFLHGAGGRRDYIIHYLHLRKWCDRKGPRPRTRISL